MLILLKNILKVLKNSAKQIYTPPQQLGYRNPPTHNDFDPSPN